MQAASSVASKSNISALCVTWPEGAIYHVPVTHDSADKASKI